MSFWSSEKLIQRVASGNLIVPFQRGRVKHAAYELALDNQYFLTADNSSTKQTLQNGEQLGIPPGQFALLVSKEKVKIPLDAMGFISIKAGIKFRGLVNISGFHVDPGFDGHLKFSVYNAGGKTIVLESGRPTFLLWFASLDRETEDNYKGTHQNQAAITASDVMELRGESPSPATLDKRLHKLEVELELWKKVTLRVSVGVLMTLFSAFLGFSLYQMDLGKPKSHLSPDTQQGTAFPASEDDDLEGKVPPPGPNTPSSSEQPDDKRGKTPIPTPGDLEGKAPPGPNTPSSSGQPGDKRGKTHSSTPENSGKKDLSQPVAQVPLE